MRKPRSAAEAFEEAIEEKIKDNKDLNENEVRRNEKNALRQAIDDQISPREWRMSLAVKQGNADKLWDLIAAAIENGFIKHFGLAGEDASKMRGRNVVRIRTEEGGDKTRRMNQTPEDGQAEDVPGPIASDLIGPKGDKPGIKVITALCNLLANGEAPRKLIPFIGGASGTALNKVSKTGEQDARPACAREYWRRLVGKALLSTEVSNLMEYLLPHQLAVGVPGGVEVMAHLARQWMDDHRDDSDRLLLAYDEGNAHNEVDRHTFLRRMGEIAPGLCRWLEFISIRLCYRGFLSRS